MLMQLNRLGKSFGAEVILKDISFSLGQQDRVAIVGRNGSGKSTLLKIMAEQIDQDVGDIYKQKDLSIGYLPQQAQLQSQRTVWEEMLGVFTKTRQLKNQLQRLEEELAEATGHEQTALLEK